jgi:hypothetical protein
MTWTARCTVEGVEIDHDTERIEVVLAAAAEEMVTLYPDAPSLRGIVSNTEGDIRSLKIRMYLKGSDTALRAGDRVTISGHFDGKPTTG